MCLAKAKCKDDESNLGSNFENDDRINKKEQVRGVEQYEAFFTCSPSYTINRL